VSVVLKLALRGAHISDAARLLIIILNCGRKLAREERDTGWCAEGGCRGDERVLTRSGRSRAAACRRRRLGFTQSSSTSCSCCHRSYRGVGNNLPLSPAAEDIDVGFVAERRRLVERRIATVALCFAEALRKSCHEEGKEKCATCCLQQPATIGERVKIKFDHVFLFKLQLLNPLSV
jgi:hypothetical protein